MRGDRISLAVGIAACAACTLTTPLGGYVGDPFAEPEPEPQSDGGAKADAADAARRDAAPVPLAVSALALVSAANGKVVAGYEKLSNGVKLPPVSTNWTIRADVTGTPESVQFDVDAAAFNTENIAPYYLCADDQIIVNPCALATGMHTLRATPYSGPDGTGTSGAALTVTVVVP